MREAARVVAVLATALGGPACCGSGWPAGMSHPGTGAPICSLPYTTTHVELEVLGVGQQVLEQRFPAVYSFVAAP
jgi:hypothetical protein